jgi:hypothetical protein
LEGFKIPAGGSVGAVFRDTGRQIFEFNMVGDFVFTSCSDPAAKVTLVAAVLIALGRPGPSGAELSIRSGESEPGGGESRGRFRDGCPFCAYSGLFCGETAAGRGADGEAEIAVEFLTKEEPAAGLDELKEDWIWEC